ncbi:MSMEG_0567/Sll0786 family nitrogen starvation N-acetyltransferase [Burkholderia sp. LMU1-1-1.1]|jgi:putative N-acetyltransferase (TIGR04045 family)|uniref:MSMEG_0567/Sll0786 family nitrogen starvation N-acetyltransferase n=1 Tax=Burkholderia sp. LMU1-1-1.1 TaxID=3135266 RepID=UPI00341C8FF2
MNTALLVRPAPTAPAGPTVRIKLATSDAERQAALRLRHTVFCGEQGLFDGDDIDDIDATALTLVAIAGAGEVAGTVRIHHAAGGVWWGSRLAVARPARRQAAVGSGLIRLAVGSARALGCTTFLAHVQEQNVAMFEQLHWRSLGPLELHGRVHHLMRADLGFYPPIADGASGFLCARGAP